MASGSALPSQEKCWVHYDSTTYEHTDKINSISRTHVLNSERCLCHRIPSDFHRKFVPNIEHNYSKSRSHIRLLSCRFRIIFIFVLLVSISMMNVGSQLIFSLTLSLPRDLYQLSLDDAPVVCLFLRPQQSKANSHELRPAKHTSFRVTLPGFCNDLLHVPAVLSHYKVL